MVNNFERFKRNVLLLVINDPKKNIDMASDSAYSALKNTVDAVNQGKFDNEVAENINNYSESVILFRNALNNNDASYTVRATTAQEFMNRQKDFLDTVKSMPLAKRTLLYNCLNAKTNNLLGNFSDFADQDLTYIFEPFTALVLNDYLPKSSYADNMFTDTVPQPIPVVTSTANQANQNFGATLTVLSDDSLNFDDSDSVELTIPVDTK
jgi:hypothetical protein